jgi:hypothetical protein
MPLDQATPRERRPTVVRSPLRVLPEPSRGKLRWLPKRIETALKRVLGGYKPGGWFARWMRQQPMVAVGNGDGGPRARGEEYVLRHGSRARRAERIGNAAAVYQVLLRSVDLKTGRLGRSTAAGWEYPRVLDIDRWAFGDTKPCERSLRRTERILQEAAAYGLVTVEERIEPTKDGFRSQVAVKRVTDAFWTLFSIARNQAELMAASVLGEKRAEGDRVAQLGRTASTGGLVTLRDLIQSGGAAAVPPPPRPAGGAPPGYDEPAPSLAAADAIARLKELLGT